MEKYHPSKDGTMVDIIKAVKDIAITLLGSWLNKLNKPTNVASLVPRPAIVTGSIPIIVAKDSKGMKYKYGTLTANAWATINVNV